MLFCLALAGVLFVAQTYLVALLEPLSSAQLAADPGKQGAAFYDAVDASVGAWLHNLVAVSKAIGAAFAALAGQAAAAGCSTRWPATAGCPGRWPGPTPGCRGRRWGARR